MHNFIAVVCLALLATRVKGQGSTECSGSQLDWYSTVVGETPCSGYDAIYIPGAGSLQDYWNASYDGTHKSHCYTPVMRNFSATVQTATHGEMGLGSLSSSPTLSTPTVTVIKSTPVGTGMIAGIVIGSVCFLATMAIAYWILRRRRNRTETSVAESLSTSSHSGSIIPYFPTQWSTPPPRKCQNLASTTTPSSIQDGVFDSSHRMREHQMNAASSRNSGSGSLPPAYGQ
ncbi:hypothetical protein C8R44DRAFT_737550 [Mycena epipterygia]|nr:hypothetical protein C8R44DRAFT_737550 [Mycena epipterygia]